MCSDHIRGPYGNQVFIEYVEQHRPGIGFLRISKMRFRGDFRMGTFPAVDDLRTTWHIAWRARIDRDCRTDCFVHTPRAVHKIGFGPRVTDYRSRPRAVIW
jgi:hypothetical protein